MSIDFDADAVRRCMDRSGDEERAEQAARAKGWTRDGDNGGIIFNTQHYDSWKAAVSWAPAHGSVYDNWTECCDAEGITYKEGL